MRILGNALAVQWLGLSAFIARPGFNPWSGNLDPTSPTALSKKKKKRKSFVSNFFLSCLFFANRNLIFIPISGFVFLVNRGKLSSH